MLHQLAESIDNAKDLESLVRPILSLIECVTGMESTYLTTIDSDGGFQHILFARNSAQMRIPEGLSVPWGDTLCKRALDEGRAFTDDVNGCWGDSEAARTLGIQTYVSQPVHRLDGSVWGTLCAASAHRVDIDASKISILRMFSELIAHQIAREERLRLLEATNVRLQTESCVDPLTGVANRRGLLSALTRMLSRYHADGSGLQIAFVDLDNFKTINDAHGHQVGDALLRHVATQLGVAVRPGDLVSRYGGDEFVVAIQGSPALRLAERLEQLIAEPLAVGEHLLHSHASVGVVAATSDDRSAESLNARADAAMYAGKQNRRSPGEPQTGVA